MTTGFDINCETLFSWLDFLKSGGPLPTSSSAAWCDVGWTAGSTGPWVAVEGLFTALLAAILMCHQRLLILGSSKQMKNSHWSNKGAELNLFSMVPFRLSPSNCMGTSFALFCFLLGSIVGYTREFCLNIINFLFYLCLALHLRVIKKKLCVCLHVSLVKDLHGEGWQAAFHVFIHLVLTHRGWFLSS